jgi:hypothetical protein
VPAHESPQRVMAPSRPQEQVDDDGDEPHATSLRRSQVAHSARGGVSGPIAPTGSRRRCPRRRRTARPPPPHRPLPR